MKNEKRIRRRRIVSLLLMGALIGGMSLPLPVQAATGYTAINPLKEVTGKEDSAKQLDDTVTYRDIYDGSSGTRNSDEQSMVTSSLNIKGWNNLPVYEEWLGMAFCFASQSQYKGKNMFDNLFVYDGSGDYPISYQGANGDMLEKGDSGFSSSKAYRESGLKAADSTATLANQILGEIGSVLVQGQLGVLDSGKTLSAEKCVEGSGVSAYKTKLEGYGLSPNSNFYHVSRTFAGRAGKGTYDVLNVGAIFYDFSYDMVDADVIKSAVSNVDQSSLGNNKDLHAYLENNSLPGVTYNISKDSPVSVTSAKNQTSTLQNMSCAYEEEAGTDASVTRSTSSEIALTESTSVTTSFGTDGIAKLLSGTQFTWEVSAGFESSQSWTKALETTNSSHTITKKSASTSLDVPPHTQTIIEIQKGHTQFSLNYDSPICVRYKVLLYQNTVSVNSDGSLRTEGAHNNILARFGGNKNSANMASNNYAAGNLYNCYQKRSDANYQTLNGTAGVGAAYWSGMDSTSYCNSYAAGYGYEYPYQWLSEDLFKYQPYSVTGGNLSAYDVSTNIIAHDFQPLYSLKSIEPTGAQEYTLHPGETLNTDTIPLRGTDRSGVDYYGFKSSQGQWKIVDKTGNPLSTSSVIRLDTNPQTKKTTIAALAKGDAYIQYFIDENAYQSAEDADRHVSNSQVTRTIIPVHVNPILVNSITLNPGSKDIKVGETVKLTATVLPANAANPSVTWSSSNQTYATVEADGTVTAKSPGTCTITAAAADGSGVKGTADITVKPVLVETLVLSPKTDTIKMGESIRLTAQIAPANATNQRLVWNSSNNSVAVVSSNGEVTAIGEGRASIFAETTDGSRISANSIITVPKSVGYQVIFKDWNESILQQTTVQEYEDAVPPASPVRPGYVFSGWDTGYTRVTSELTITAMYTPVSYNIAYNKNGGKGTMNQSETVFDQILRLPNLEFFRTGFTFDSWNTRPDGTGIEYADQAGVKNLTTAKDSTVILYAMWDSIITQVSPNQKSLNVAAGDSQDEILKKLTGLVITGELAEHDSDDADQSTRVSFANSKANWRISGDSAYGTFQVPEGSALQKASDTDTQSVTVTISLHRIPEPDTELQKPKVYRITYRMNNGKNHRANPSTYVSGVKNITLMAPIRAGYVFDGWYTNSKFTKASKITSIAKTERKNLTLYAKWSKVMLKKAVISSAKNVASKKLAVTVKPVPGSAGYEVQYSTSSKWKNAKKKSGTSKKITLTKLKKGKIYYVRIRAFKKDSAGKLVYGAFSKTKKVKIMR